MKNNYDSFAKFQSKCKKNTIEISINIQKDYQIPEFDMIKDIKYDENGFKELRNFNHKTIEIAQENGGMFVSDVLKLKDKDIISLVDSSIHPKDFFVIPALKVLQKALLKYLKNSGQIDRYNREISNLVCFCKHVTDLEINKCFKDGKTSFEEVQKHTQAGTGCGSCINKTKELIEQYRKTAIGKIN